MNLNAKRIYLNPSSLKLTVAFKSDSKYIYKIFENMKTEFDGISTTLSITVKN